MGKIIPFVLISICVVMAVVSIAFCMFCLAHNAVLQFFVGAACSFTFGIQFLIWMRIIEEM